MRIGRSLTLSQHREIPVRRKVTRVACIKRYKFEFIGRLLLPAVCCVLLPAPWPTPLAPGAWASSDPVFTALLIDGGTAAGRILSIGPKAIQIQSADGTAQDLPFDRLVKLSREASLPFPLPELAHVILPDGDRIMRVTIGSTTDTDFELKSDVLGNLAIPLESVLGLLISTPADAETLEAWWDRVMAEPRTTEVVWLANGDRLTGGFLGLDERRLKFQVAGKPVDLERNGVVAIGFDPALAKYPRSAGDYLEVTLRDGTRLGLHNASLQDHLVTARTRFGRTIRFPLGELSRIHVRGSRIVYLTEREPIRAKYIPYVGPAREYRRDRTVRGGMFRLAGQNFDRGLGMQSRTILAYDLKPDDRRFQALVGVDERAGPLGSVVFRVLTDSQERFTSPPLSAVDPPRTVDIDLKGAKHLILIAEFGDRGDVRDLADWVEARLIR
jgi:hypothetical protein